MQTWWLLAFEFFVIQYALADNLFGTQADSLKWDSNENIIFIQNMARQKVIETEDKQYSSPNPIEEIMKIECSDIDVNKIEQQILQAKYKAKKQELGFVLESGYRRTGNSNRQRGFIGLGWNILGSGYFDYQSQAKQLEYQLQISHLQYQPKRLLDLFKCRDKILWQYFNHLKLNILKDQKKVLSHYYALMKQAYFLGKIYLDELTKIEYQLNKISNIILNYDDQPFYDEQFFVDLPKNPKVVDIHLYNILSAVHADQSYNEIARLKKEILVEANKTRYDSKLKLYARVGVNEGFEIDEEDEGTGLTTGINFSMPLWKPKNRYINYEVLKSQMVQEQKKEDIVLELLRLSNAYREKFNDLRLMHYKHLITQERLRRALLRMKQEQQKTNHFDVSGYVILTKSLAEFLDVRFELIAVQESLYRQLLHVFTQIGLGYQHGFLKEIDLSTDYDRARLGKRSIYIWSKTFNQYNNDFLFDVFRTKAISRAIVSAGKKTHWSKLLNFLKLAKKYGITVELMVSSTQWIFPAKAAKVKKVLAKLFAVAKTVHLDVEPHILDDYKKNQQLYLAYYIRMLKLAYQSKGENTRLHVSVPIWFRQPLIAQISRYTDRIYVMAYGITKLSKLQKKLLPYLSIDTKKLVVALRPRDFTDELALELFIEDIYKNLDVKAFAFHDMKQFISLMNH